MGEFRFASFPPVSAHGSRIALLTAQAMSHPQVVKEHIYPALIYEVDKAVAIAGHLYIGKCQGIGHAVYMGGPNPYTLAG